MIPQGPDKQMMKVPEDVPEKRKLHTIGISVPPAISVKRDIPYDVGAIPLAVQATSPLHAPFIPWIRAFFGALDPGSF